jgi:hypothetical protein
VDPRAGMDFMEERIISCPYRESNPDSFAVEADIQTALFGLAPSDFLTESSEQVETVLVPRRGASWCV